MFNTQGEMVVTKRIAIPVPLRMGTLQPALFKAFSIDSGTIAISDGKDRVTMSSPHCAISHAMHLSFCQLGIRGCTTQHCGVRKGHGIPNEFSHLTYELSRFRSVEECHAAGMDGQCLAPLPFSTPANPSRNLEIASGAVAPTIAELASSSSNGARGSRLDVSSRGISAESSRIIVFAPPLRKLWGPESPELGN